MNGELHHLALPPLTNIGAGQKRLTFNQELKRGGFSIIYKGSYKDDHKPEKIVAIKEYLPKECAIRREGTDVVAVPEKKGDFDEGLKSFRDEAIILNKFKHPNIVPFYDIFEAYKTAYIVMELVEGQDLSEYLREKGGTPREDELKDILFPLLDALEAVHQKNFLHRDIKPSNIILRKSDSSVSPVLLDFGAAHPMGPNQKVMVTDHYSPPEQYGRGRKQGPWTDIYALGAVCYEALTSMPPPKGDDREGDHDTFSPCYNVDGERTEFCEAIDKALEIDPRKRPQTVEQWKEMMQQPEPPADEVPPTKQGPISRKPRFKWFSRASIVAFLLQVLLQVLLLVEVDKYIDNYRKEWEKRQEKAELDRSREEAEEAELKAELDRFYVETGERRGPKPDKGHEGEPDLHIAVRLNLPRLTKDLLNKGADIHAKVEGGWMSGWTVLHFAAEVNAVEMAKEFLARKAYVNATDEDGRTPLHFAARQGHSAVAGLLLEAPGVEVDATDKDGRTPLHHAARQGHSAVAGLLLEAPGVEVNATDKDDGWMPLHYAAAINAVETAKVLLAEKAYVNVTDKDGRTPLHLAAWQGHSAVAGLLLEAPGVEVNVTDKDDWTPLHHAVRRTHPKMVDVLLYAEADMNARDKDGNTPKDMNHSESIGELFDYYTRLRESLKSLRESSK